MPGALLHFFNKNHIIFAEAFYKNHIIFAEAFYKNHIIFAEAWSGGVIFPYSSAPIGVGEGVAREA